MKRLAISTVIVLLVASSAAADVVRRHIAWDGMVMGKGTSKIRGLIEMVGGKVAGTTSVEVSYTGDASNVTRSWHVHRGSCAKAGRMLGVVTAYPLLRVNATGAVKAKATLRVALPDTGSFHLDIHESSGATGTVVACGELLLEE